jgi:sialate O-acetylesterase
MKADGMHLKPRNRSRSPQSDAPDSRCPPGWFGGRARRRAWRRLAGAAALVCAGHALANVSVSNAFSNHMVLQRGMAAPIWGKADAGEQVAVTFRGQSKTAATGSDGKWTVAIDPLAAGGPFDLVIKGKNTVTVTDVMVGEVWQCAGQSNMDTRMSYYANYADSVRAANLPNLRYYTLRQPGQVTKWQVVTPGTVGDLSALGFFFGKEIQKSQNVPVGLVVTAVGGTFISQWLDPASLAADAVLKSNGDTANGNMYDQWVAPVVGFGLRGTVWIQGEQDRTSALAPLYRDRFQALIKGWRKAWGQGDFPFYFLQLANYSTVQTDANENSTSSVIREAQRLALNLPQTAMAVAIDIGDVTELHFPDKRDAGMRLALPAKALLYGQTDLVYSGPMYATKSIEGAKIHLRFGQLGGGLVAKGGGSLKGFAIAGSDGKFVWAEAAIHGDTITVSSAQVTQPTQVRYDWGGNPTGNLYNAEGLPASPFQTEGPQLTVGLAGRGGVANRTSGMGGASLEATAGINALGRVQAERKATAEAGVRFVPPATERSGPK